MNRDALMKVTRLDKSTAMSVSLWGFTETQQCLELNANVRMLTCNDSANMLMLNRS